jgi:hypothetical protein
MAIAAISRIPSFDFMCLGPLFFIQVVALSARLDEISLPSAARPKRTNFWPIWPSWWGRPRGPLPPSNCAEVAGAGASPPLRPPGAAARRPGWAAPSPKPPKKAPRGR